jgi:hypothetical protein
VELAVWLRAALDRTDASLVSQRSIIYHGVNQWETMLGEHSAWFVDRFSWLSNYGVRAATCPFPFDEFGMWQHSANTIWRDPKDPTGKQRFGLPVPDDAIILAKPGIVPGVAGEIDCNVLGNVSIEDLQRGTRPWSPLDLDDVRDRQRAFRRLGVDCGKLDGLWGPRCRAALVIVQRKVGIEPTGMWGVETRAALEGALAMS